MPALSLDQLTLAATLKAHAVPVPEFGEGVVAYIAELTADERDARIDVAWTDHKAARGNDSQVGVRAWVVAACLCEGPDRKFSAKTPEEIANMAALLGNQSGVPVTRMYVKVQEANGIGEDQVAELEKN